MTLPALPTPQHIDLHTHSTASDGLFPPEELVRRAQDAGLDLIALTDHDSTEGVAAAQHAGDALNVTVIPGIEVNTYLPSGQGEAHVLGYYVDTAQPEFQSTLRTLRDVRERRGERMVERLRAAGLDITWDRVRELAHGAVGRPHVAQALVERGNVTSVAEAFDTYLTPGKPGYVPRYKLTPRDAVRLIRSAHGVAVLAHPAGITGLAEALVPSLVAVGLGGLECYYGQYDTATVERLVTLAESFQLIATGGSDYHGPGIHPTPLGGRAVPPEAALLLYERAETARHEVAPAFVLPAPPPESGT